MNHEILTLIEKEFDVNNLKIKMFLNLLGLLNC